ncbi:MAG: helix-turn-helix domain-containing protein [Proteobacteria bacterium]|nr:helix-turn-helix domain-containing protein [Pseudomonadota bacterium]MCL2306757.1 helix-turn-helix domain-containing protein [Pseudomonadota bacterium]
MQSTAEAAARLGISQRRLQALLKEGRVKGAQQVGRSWVIPDNPQITAGTRGPEPVFKTVRPPRSKSK